MTWWQAYDQYEPIGPATERHLLASVLALLVNVHRDPKRSSAVSPEDFLPGLDHHQPTEPADAAMKIKAMFGAIAAGQRKKGKA
jgi:hypothetical protein